MTIPTICNEGCNQEFTVSSLEIEKMNDGVEKTYFDCPHCKHRYVAYYTDPEIRKLQDDINNLGYSKNVNDSTIADIMIKRNKKLMKELRLKVEGGKDDGQ
ncbi:hypothetical protein ABGV40_14780 [Paenibacillus amylolyticus]|uniref:hypothetical protein n=1 Tax=Paenibacillus amylolyticus TaxID=1451 RepID=UPI003242D4FF